MAEKLFILILISFLLLSLIVGVLVAVPVTKSSIGFADLKLYYNIYLEESNFPQFLSNLIWKYDRDILLERECKTIG